VQKFNTKNNQPGDSDKAEIATVEEVQPDWSVADCWTAELLVAVSTDHSL